MSSENRSMIRCKLLDIGSLRTWRLSPCRLDAALHTRERGDRHGLTHRHDLVGCRRDAEPRGTRPGRVRVGCAGGALSSRLDRPVLGRPCSSWPRRACRTSTSWSGCTGCYTHVDRRGRLVALLAAIGLRRVDGRLADAAASGPRVAATAAYASHLLLDWLGDDTTRADRHHGAVAVDRRLLPVRAALVPADLAPLLAARLLDHEPARDRREMLVLMPLGRDRRVGACTQTGSAARVRTPRRAQRRE